MNKDVFRGYENPQAKLTRNAFDLGYDSKFSARAGMLYPVDVLETVPGDHHEINYNYLVRTLPLNNTAFLRCKIYLHTYFVPYSSLWKQWMSFISQRNNPMSSASKGYSYAPCFNLSKLSEGLQYAYLQAYDQDDSSLKQMAQFSFKLQEMLGYGIPYIQEIEGVPTEGSVLKSDALVSVFRAAAYQKIWFENYRNPYYDTNVDPTYFNFDDLQCTNSVTANINTRSGAEITNILKLFTPRFRQWHRDLYTSLLPSTQFGDVSIVETGISSGVGSRVDVELPLTANVPGGALVDISQGFASINGDLYAPTVELSGQSNTHKQYLSIMANTGQVVSESAVTQGTVINNDFSLESTDGDARFTSQSDFNMSGQLNQPMHVSGVASGQINVPAGGTGAFDVLQLRKAEAIQKWRETTLRAGQRAYNQQIAHFGVSPAFDEDMYSKYLGGTDSWLTIDDVTATADTMTGNDQFSSIVGSQRGKAISVDSPNKVVFDSKDFGIIMTLMSICPDVPYTSHRVDKHNTMLEPFDFYTPEYQNLGLEAVQHGELSMLDVLYPLSDIDISSVVGFAPRYYAYKARASRVYGEFNQFGNIVNRSSTVDPDDDDSYIGSVSRGVLRSFVPSKWALPHNMSIMTYDPDGESPTPGLRASDFYVRPDILNNIFVYTDSFSEVGDQFYFDFRVNCKSVRPMSVLGLPNY